MQNHYPAIDILKSISRVMVDVVSLKQRKNANKLKAIMAAYKKAEDLINIGAYVAGSSRTIDYAIDMMEKVNSYLKQEIEEKVSFEDSVQQLEDLFDPSTT